MLDELLINPCYLVLEIQPKNLQEEAEERELCKAQLPILLLCCRQQGPLALCLGEPYRELAALWGGGA